jgi:hypothetical protein
LRNELGILAGILEKADFFGILSVEEWWVENDGWSERRYNRATEFG